jgi:ferredoxin
MARWSCSTRVSPDAFSVSKKGELTLLTPRPSEDQRRAVELAVEYCPTHALRIEKD